MAFTYTLISYAILFSIIGCLYIYYNRSKLFRSSTISTPITPQSTPKAPKARAARLKSPRVLKNEVASTEDSSSTSYNSIESESAAAPVKALRIVADSEPFDNVVKSRSRPAKSTEEKLTKKQRQNAAKKKKQREIRALQEEDRKEKLREYQTERAKVRQNDVKKKSNAAEGNEWQVVTRQKGANSYKKKSAEVEMNEESLW